MTPRSSGGTSAAGLAEIFAEHKRLDTLLAFVPFYGPRRIQRSELHTAEEKQNLSRLSTGLTIVAVIALLLSLPNAADRNVELQARMDDEIRVLNEIAIEYRAQHRAYPDPETWLLLAARADPRFFDPWGRPYRYEASEDTGVSIGSLGRDGVERGIGEDADLWLHFPPPGASETADHAE